MPGRVADPGPSEPARPQAGLKLSDLAYARIAAGIGGGDYPVGSKLPTENALAELLSVSRPVVREALSRLRDDGLVASRRGSGTVVRRAPIEGERRLSPLSSIADMRRCLEFRLSLESEIAYHAAAALTADSERAILSALSRLEAQLPSGEIDIDDDFAFHAAVARASGNRFFAATLLSMRDPVTSGMNITRHFALLRTRERLAALHGEHVRIADSIRARDPEAARAAMRTHLANAIARAFDDA